MMQLAFFILAFTSLGQIFARDCSTAPGVNGCSIPDWVPYKRTFTPACYKHDVCYSCGSTKGVSRDECDQMFKDNMYEICGWRWMCKVVGANGYYEAVQEYGGSHYKTNSPGWCQESWVNNCMY